MVHHNVVDSPDTALQAGMRDITHSYRPGQHVAERWFAAPARPSIPQGAPWASVRNGDTLSLYVPEFADAAAGHWAFAERSGFGGLSTGARSDAVDDTARAVLYRDGKQITASDTGAWGTVEVPSGKAEYRLDLTTARVSDDWHFGTSTNTSWMFRSDTTTSPETLPLLQVDYSVPVDAQNAVGSGRRHTIGLKVRMQDGMATPRGVTLKVETSYDDGKSWATAHTAQRGNNRFTATIERPSRLRGDAYATLRITASDAAGNTVRQTVNRAYLHSGTR
ncbi:hypothetical protein ACFZAU_40840 [Streptomyces sp. NPDC008238]